MSSNVHPKLRTVHYVCMFWYFSRFSLGEGGREVKAPELWACWSSPVTVRPHGAPRLTPGTRASPKRSPPTASVLRCQMLVLPQNSALYLASSTEYRVRNTYNCIQDSRILLYIPVISRILIRTRCKYKSPDNTLNISENESKRYRQKPSSNHSLYICRSMFS